MENDKLFALLICLAMTHAPVETDLVDIICPVAF